MSEREKTEALRWVFDWIDATGDVPPLVKIEQALSAEPDAVKILRFVSGQWRNSWGNFERQAALETVIDYINEHFVRLTDEPPGWEWARRTNEQEQ